MNFSKTIVAIFLISSTIYTAHYGITNFKREDAPAAQVSTTSTDTDPIIFSNRRYVEYSVPNGDTSFKSYMSYKAITNTRSSQYKLQQDAYTDNYGLRKYKGYYMVALGTFYADKIGDVVRITLDSGDSFFAVVGDVKADCHTDGTNRYYPMSDGRKNVVEFIVDISSLDAKARKSGDISSIPTFSGNVTKIERVYE